MTLILRDFRITFFATLLAFAPIYATAEAISPQITVTGEGSVLITPDMARINLGVVQEADTAADAMSAMSDGMADILAQLQAAGVEATHIQTGNLRLDQRYEDFNNGPRKAIGYAAYADVQVQVFELDNLGAILDAAVRDGANQMNGLQFDVVDRAPHLIEARKTAVADAFAKAQVYAEAAGVSLGQINIISESGGNNGPMPMMAEASFDAGSRSVPISAGEMSIGANVTIQWTLIE